MSKYTINEREAVENFIDLNLNEKVILLDIWHYALNIELEHGNKNKITNITNDNIIMISQIALAHIMKFPDYYQRLKKMELQAEKFWKKKNKPNIFRSKF